MKVSDLRTENKALSWDGLIAGHVYLADDGTVIMATDEDKYVELTGENHGSIYSWDTFQMGSQTTFTELEAELIIR